MQGKIVKGISGFYYVHVAESGIYECKAKGAFRKENRKPLVGDNVEIAILDSEKKLGNVDEILPRANSLIRPAVANIDMALVIFAATSPEPNLNLLDRFLCMMEYQHVPTTICINKCDLVQQDELDKLKAVYEAAGYPMIFTSVKEKQNIKELQALLHGKTTAVAGPSGGSKSSLVNSLQDGIVMETGGISRKLERGKHTTRHSQIIPLGKESYIMDTPGFSSLDVPGFEKEDLWNCFPEFLPYEPYCKFQGCSHISEPQCGVKEALQEGKIHPVRYENYKLLYEELKNRKKVY